MVSKPRSALSRGMALIVRYDITSIALLNLSTTDEANILQRNEGEIYVHYANTDKRMDEWIPESAVREVVDGQADGRSGSNRKRKRRGSRPGTLSPTLPALAGAFNSIPDPGSNGVEEVPMTEEEYDIEHHKKIYKMRNFDKVNFGEWQIKTWFVAFLFTMSSVSINLQVLLPLSADRIRGRRGCCCTRFIFEHSISKNPRSQQDDDTLPWPNVRSTSRRTRSYAWLRREVHPLGMRQVLQIHG